MLSIDPERPLPCRLRKRVAESLGLPLQVVEAHWHAGRIRAITPESDSSRPLSLDALVFDEDRLFFDGRPIEGAPARSYALLNKPKHVTSTTHDPLGQTDLSAYLRQMPAGCFPVGRLDRETTGLLLCTNDGNLAHAVLRPDHETTKTYWLWLDDLLEPHDPRLERMVEGVEHHGQVLSAKHARIIARTEYSTELELILTQGKKRQIRHMCWALQLHLTHLHRSRIGPLSDAGLELGAWRLLTEEEVEALWAATGGRAQLRKRRVAALVRMARAARAEGAPMSRLEAFLAHEPGAG
ncbi:MAG TPA: pseudouridine synthase [Polyangiaceae bacterium]|nr:pseudouridine synthase [Polyangiaceae bacterium]